MFKCEVHKDPQIATPTVQAVFTNRATKVLGPKVDLHYCSAGTQEMLLLTFTASKTFLFPLSLCGGQAQSISSLRAKETRLCGSIMNICPGDCTGWLLVPSAYVISSFCLTDQFVRWWCPEPCSDDLSKLTVLGLGLRSRALLDGLDLKCPKWHLFSNKVN